MTIPHTICEELAFLVGMSHPTKPILQHADKNLPRW
jgi:hypothetical protein